MRQLWKLQQAYWGIATLAFAWTLLAAAGCTSDSGERIKVNSAVGPGVTFEAHGDAYDWVPERTSDSHDPWNDVPSVHQLFRELVQYEMNAKGYHRQAGSSTAFKLDDRLVRRTVGNPSNPGVDRRIHTIALYVLNPNSESVAWTSQAEIEFRERAQSSAEIRERLERVVKEILAPIKPRG
jgi:hypothetical protein